MNLNLRVETPADYPLTQALTREAFWDVYAPGCTEHFILSNLRKSPAFVPELSVVAEVDGAMAGHIAYTRARLLTQSAQAQEVLTFGPLSVLPERQGQGVGSALVRHTLDAARSMGFRGVCIYGDPRYYARFGFGCGEKYGVRTAQGKFACALLALELVPGALAGGGRFAEDGAYAVDEAALAAFDAQYPPREKGRRDSQRVFEVLSSLQY